MVNSQFGAASITKPTPAWANWMFRVFFYIGNFVTFLLSVDGTVDPEVALTIIKWNSIIVVAVHGFSRMWGINTRELEKEAKDAFDQAKQK